MSIEYCESCGRRLSHTEKRLCHGCHHYVCNPCAERAPVGRHQLRSHRIKKEAKPNEN
jgi:hypothetical protein